MKCIKVNRQIVSLENVLEAFDNGAGICVKYKSGFVHPTAKVFNHDSVHISVSDRDSRKKVLNKIFEILTKGA